MIAANHIAANDIKPNPGKIKSLLNGKGVVVEFVGPTGSGKTTNCHYFSDLLKTFGFNVYVFSDLKEYFYNLNYLRQFYLILKTLTTKGPDIISYTSTLAYYGIFSIDSIYRYMKIIVFNEILKLFIQKKKPDIILLDQWIIQGLWSATIFKHTVYNNLQNKLSHFYFPTDFVLYFDIDVETAAQRIASREHERSRFDTMNSEKRLAELKKYNGYLHQLYQNSNCKNKFMFSTTENPAKNAEMFLNKLEQLYCMINL